MLDFMRRQAQGWIVKVLFAIIVLSFTMWGVGDYFSGSSQVTVATVGDASITQQALRAEVRSQRQRLRRMTGQDVEPGKVRKEVLARMIRDRLQQQEARRLGLTATDTAVRQAITSQPAFRQNGRFSTTAYERMVERSGMTTSQYEGRIRQDLAVQAMRVFLREGSVVTGHGITTAFRREKGKRVVRFFRLAPSTFTDKVSLGQKEVRRYYQNSEGAYRRPPRARVQYVLFSPATIAPQIEPTEAELRSYLKAHADRYAKDDGALPTLSAVRPEVVDDWRQDKAVDRIFERLPTFKDLLYTRKDLTAVAEELGLRVREAGWIPAEGPLPEGVPQASAFRKRAMQGAPGQNSRAIELGDARFAGLHVVERQQAAKKPFEAVQKQVRADLRAKKARKLAKKAAEKARQKIVKGTSLQAQARAHASELARAGPANRDRARAQWPSGLAEPVFSRSQGEVGVAHLRGSEWAVFRVAEVKDPNMEALSAEKRQELAKSIRQGRGQARHEAYLDRLRQRYAVQIREEVAPR